MVIITMIGILPENEIDFEDKEDKIKELLDISKYSLYAELCEDWLLPPCSSRGVRIDNSKVTKDYLWGVKVGKYYRVGYQEYKRFELELSKKHLRKVGYGCSALLLKKLDYLLAFQGKPLLGFSTHESPEMGWLIKVGLRKPDRQVHRPLKLNRLVGSRDKS